MLMLTKVGKATKLCAESCLVDVESFDFKQKISRKEIRDHMLMMKKSYRIPVSRLMISV